MENKPLNTDNKLFKPIAALALATVFLLLIPLIAMQYTDEVVWTPSDFIFAGILLFGSGITYILVTRLLAPGKRDNIVYRVAVGLALFTGLFLIWANGAVGIIGSEGNPINLLYFGVIAVGIIGAFIARFQPHGMALTLFLTAIAQALVTLYALLTGEQHALTGVYHSSTARSVIQIIGVNGFFITLWIVSALIFKYVAKEQPPAKAGGEG